MIVVPRKRLLCNIFKLNILFATIIYPFIIINSRNYYYYSYIYIG